MYRFMDEDWFQVTFVYRGGCRGSSGTEVYVVGDFCGWNVDEEYRMKSCDEGFKVVVPLQEGFYKYKFLVNGEWLADEHCPHKDNSAFQNSIIFVHMDPNVYGIRPQDPPFREYHRANSGGEHFQVFCPPIPDSILSWGILERQVYVYLPPSYFTNADSQQRYPVVYAHDGQNVFSTPGTHGGPVCGGMYIDGKLDHFWNLGLIPEFILVAIPNSDFVCIGNRKREYCPPILMSTSDAPFVRYVTTVVKNLVDNTFRTLSSPDNTIILGCSMGGLLAFNMAYTSPEIFGCAVCLSPSLWYTDKTDCSTFDLVRNAKSSCRIYIDSGDSEGDNMYETLQMAETLKGCGWEEGRDYSYYLDVASSARYDGITHGEHVWKERLDRALKFAFKV